jgi:hypothetical protein
MTLESRKFTPAGDMMASNELIALQKLIYEKKMTVKQDIEIKTVKLLTLEKSITDYARKYRLWKPHHKTIDDLYSTVKEAKRWQNNARGMIMVFYNHCIFIINSAPNPVMMKSVRIWKSATP